jgi:putative glycosyltransferase (TIGR04372 family)
MKMKPIFSVIIPTYNTGKIIRKTLDSLVGQTYKNFEVIVSDDGSKDETLSIVREYGAKLNLIILENENWGGPARPRNLGIRAATADWIAFLDHDDYWDENKLEETLKYLENNDVIFHDLRICSLEGKTFKTAKGRNVSPNPFVRLMTEGNGILNSSAVVRKSLIEEVNYIDESRELMTVEDFDLWLKIAKKTNRFFYINKSLGGYLIMPGQNMSGASEKQIERHIFIQQKYEVFLTEDEKKKSVAILSYAKARIYHKLSRRSEAKINYKLALCSKLISIRLKAMIGMILVNELLSELYRKMKRFPAYIPALMIIVFTRMIRPFYLVRFGVLLSNRIGHFAANTELYLCERDANINVPKNKIYLDLFYMEEPISNHQLAKMWRPLLNVCPRWLLGPVVNLNRILPGGRIHTIGNNTQSDRDVLNLCDKYPPHLEFNLEDERRGEEELQKMGIPPGAKFVCLNVRDSAYLMSHMKGNSWNYHNYRDCNIQNYLLAAEELAELGYFIIRMGAKVLKPMGSKHPRVIDYAYNGMRSDFMDIYLAAKCTFCITTATGWDSVPATAFRKPAVYTNTVPLGCVPTFSSQFIFITKRHIHATGELSLKEIFKHQLEYCMDTSAYETKNIKLLENTPEEIRDVAIEMHEKLAGIGLLSIDDEEFQRQFWEIFSVSTKQHNSEKPMHGELRSRYGAAFLRNNKTWLQ